MTSEVAMEAIYRECWELQSTLFERMSLLPCATPVPCFGRWQTAGLATVGMNPSEREFVEQDASEIVTEERRFLHRVSFSPYNKDELLEARRLAEGYFTLGNDYWQWFDAYLPFLQELGWTYKSGQACHTDLVSPFATQRGIGGFNSTLSRALRTQGRGTEMWLRVLQLMPRLEMVVGMGAGWTIVPELLGFGSWTPVETELDAKGGNTRIPKPYLLHGVGRAGANRVDVFWWRPYWSIPLTWLNAEDKVRLAKIIQGRRSQ